MVTSRAAITNWAEEGDDFGNFKGSNHHLGKKWKTTLVTPKAATTTWAELRYDFGNFEGGNRHLGKSGKLLW